MKRMLLLILLFSIQSLFASSPIIIDLKNHSKDYFPSKGVKYLEDKSNSLTLENILKKRKTLPFKENKKNIIALKRTRNPLWFHFKVIDTSQDNKKWIFELNYTYFSTIDIYYIKPNKTFTHYKTGNFKPVQKRQYPYTIFCFDLNIKKNVPYDIYLRVTKTGPILLPIRIQSYRNFLKSDRNGNLFVGIFTGIMIIMAIYNLFIFFSLREKVYLYYVLYILFFTINSTALTGVGYIFLWPNSGWMQEMAPFLLPPPSLIVFILFTKSFLHLKKLAKDINSIMNSFIILFCIIFILFLTGRPNPTLLSINNLMVTLLFIITYVGAIISYRKGFTSAKYYITGWSIYTIGFIIFQLMFFGILPYSYIFSSIIPIGSIAEVTFFAIALADKIKLEKAEKINAQHEAIRRLKENNKLKSEFVNKLEEKVDERTEELNAAMEEMEAINNNLITTNNELIEAKSLIDKDLRLAKNVQRILFHQKSLENLGYDIAIAFKPMIEVSGDFYDFYKYKDDLKGIGIFDVSGHGVSSALITMLAKSILRENFYKYIQKDLIDIFHNSNQELMKELIEANIFVTGILLRLHESRIEYINAGHPDILVKNKKNTYPILLNNESPSGIFLGAFEGSYPYEIIEIKNSHDSFFLLYSDCLIENSNKKKEQYSTERLLKSFDKAPFTTSQEILEYILHDFYSFVGENATLQDDLTVIVIRKTAT